MAEKYNLDLLIHDEDRIDAQKRYPDLWWILDFPELRELLAGADGKGGFDREANLGKAWTRRLGVAAIAAVLVALMIAAAEGVYSYSSGLSQGWKEGLSAIAAVLGLVGGAIGTLGFVLAPMKFRWLNNRIRTERLRQLYFQFLVSHAPSIVSADTDEKKNALLAIRGEKLDDFRRDYVNFSALEQTLKDKNLDKAWLVDRTDPSTDNPKATDFDTLWRMYENLRFGHQVAFAQDKPVGDLSLVSPGLKGQANAIAQTSLLCVAGMLLVHLAIVVAKACGIDTEGWGPLAHVAAVWLALFALTAHVVAEGLRPRQELERYRWYATGVQRLRKQFCVAKTPAEKLAIMQEMEELSYGELRSFIQGHHEATFSM